MGSLLTLAMTALTILNAAFSDCGITAANETLDATTAQDGLRRLNNMVSGWRTQYGTVLAIERNLFTLTAGQGTYSIGSGGDFNVPRPVTIDGAGLLLNGLGSAVTVTITRVLTVATVAQTANGLTAGDQVYVSGAVQTDYNGLQTVASVPTANTWTFVVNNSPTTPATGTISSQTVAPNPIELTIPVVTDDMYQAWQLKGQLNSQFTQCYYNQTQPLGQIILWPIPTTGANQLVLYLQSVFTGFALLTTDYSYPDVPGYAEALEYNLALRLIAPYSVSNQTIIRQITDFAYDSLMAIKWVNFKPADLQLDQAYTPNFHGTYVIQTDQGA